MTSDLVRDGDPLFTGGVAGRCCGVAGPGLVVEALRDGSGGPGDGSGSPGNASGDPGDGFDGPGDDSSDLGGHHRVPVELL